jgi:hypothetical protein
LFEILKDADTPATTGNTMKTPRVRPRGAAINAGWNAFSTIWSIAISFIIAPVLIRNMGTAQYGILLLVWSVTGILGVLQFGFGEATFRYVAYHYGGLPWALASVAFVIEHCGPGLFCRDYLV